MLQNMKKREREGDVNSAEKNVVSIIGRKFDVSFSGDALMPQPPLPLPSFLRPSSTSQVSSAR